MLIPISVLATQHGLDLKITQQVGEASTNVLNVDGVTVVHPIFVSNFIKEVMLASEVAKQDFDESELAAAITFAVEAIPFYRYLNDIENLVHHDIDLPDEVFDEFYNYYLLRGEMPYSVAKAREEDPYNWVCDRIREYLSA